MFQSRCLVEFVEAYPAGKDRNGKEYGAGARVVLRDEEQPPAAERQRLASGEWLIKMGRKPVEYRIPNAAAADIKAGSVYMVSWGLEQFGKSTSLRPQGFQYLEESKELEAPAQSTGSPLRRVGNG